MFFAKISKAYLITIQESSDPATAKGNRQKNNNESANLTTN